MLYYLSHTKIQNDDNLFKTFIEKIEAAYWPASRFQTEAKGMLARMRTTSEEDSEHPQDVLCGLPEAIAEEIGKLTVYPVLNMDAIENDWMQIPFMDKFYSYFLKRNWTLPYPDIDNLEKHVEQLINLEPIHEEKDPKQKLDTTFNFSKHFSNYYHFVNVVAVVSRLIMMFKDPKEVEHIFSGCKAMPGLTSIDSELSFNELPSKRTFVLLLAAFYHDIGKTIVDPRHGMEGSIIISSDIDSATYWIDRIWRGYDNEDRAEETHENIFDYQDILRISDFVYYHDQYGTLSTGEDGYLRIVELVQRIKRHALKYGSEESLEWSMRYIFDLWLLNVGDIITSMRNKYTKQTEWLAKDRSSEIIKEFLDSKIGKKLRHDLIVSLLIVEKYHEREHLDSTKLLEDYAYEFTINHSLERIRRLVSQSLHRPLQRKISSNKGTEVEKYLNCFLNISEQQWAATIDYCVRSVGDTQEFCKRFSWIGKMDYALGFFEKVAERVLEKTIQELQGGERTKFIRGKESLALGPLADASNDIRTIQARHLSHNFSTIVILILNHVLLRYERINKLSNIEFSDAKERLTPEKIDELIGLDGPFRSQRSMESILQTIYFYYG